MYTKLPESAKFWPIWP